MWLETVYSDTHPVIRSAEVTIRVLGADALREIGPDWDRLAANALEENPFFARPYVEAGLAHVDRAGAVKALCAFRLNSDRTQSLVGLLPFRRTLFRYGVPMRVDLAANNVFQTNGTPLIDRDHAPDVADAMLGGLGGRTGAAPNLLLPNIRRGGTVAQLLIDRAGRHGVDARPIGNLNRPVLRPGREDSEAYLARTVAPKRLRDLRRTQRRLSEQGSLTYRHTRVPSELGAAIEDFLRIEQSGWKGAGGTAFLSAPNTAAFARAAFSGSSAGQPVASADILALDGAAIAVCLNLQVGRTSFAIKCTYDESYRRFSPGLVLELLVIEHLFQSRFADEMDSCVTENGHVIQDLWDSAVEVGTLALRRPARMGLGTSAVPIDLAALEQGRARLHRHAKDRYFRTREQASSLFEALGVVRSLADRDTRTDLARRLRARLDAGSRSAMMTINSAQPNGEAAAVVAAMI